MNRICGLVVSYNRPVLLSECVLAIFQQKCAVSELIIIDNHSDVAVLRMLEEHGYIETYDTAFVTCGGYSKKILEINCDQKLIIHFVRLPQNTGGAGGFNYGMRFFYEKTDCDFLWLMDDDCVPSNTALYELIHAEQFIRNKKIKLGFVVSKTLSANRTLCRMTQPIIKKTDALIIYDAEVPCLEIENAAFVSLFIPRYVILELGLPFKEYFIWCDDLEYTTRITQKYSGFIALNSEVVHRTANNIAATDEINDNNFFKQQFGIRNKISWLRTFKGIPHALFFTFKFLKLILKASISFDKKTILLNSLLRGWFFNPQIESVQK